MPTASFDLFLPDVLIEVVGCSDPLAVKAIRDAAIEFCEKSQVWKVDLAAISTVASTATYALAPPDVEQRISDVLTARLSGIEIFPKPPKVLDEIKPGWRTTEGVVQYFTQYRPDEVTLAAVPSESVVNGLELNVSLCPARNATVIEDFIYQKYAKEISYGAQAILMAMPNKDWSNPNIAQLRRNDFENAIACAASLASKGNVNAPMRTKLYF